jgi:SAM-dependent methyltransferase
MAGKSSSELAELQALLGMASQAKALGADDMEHMDGAAAAFNYIRIADLLAAYCASLDARFPILDWGCGYGQVSWLLLQRGIKPVSFDVMERPAREAISLLQSVEVKYCADPLHLPYPSESFGAVLSVGVLEHVPDFDCSLGEIHRVLQPRGLLFIFMLPNRYSWAEWIADRRGMSAHPFKFTFGSAEEMLKSHGFTVEKRWRRNFLPRNLTGFSPKVKRVYGKFYRQVEMLDKILTNLPPSSYFSGVLEFIARKSTPL